jgi:hypothetical protein
LTGTPRKKNIPQRCKVSRCRYRCAEKPSHISLSVPSGNLTGKYKQAGHPGEDHRDAPN